MEPKFVYSPKFHLVYFLSEGPPNDHGLNLIENKELVENNARGHFDKIKLYTPKELRNLGLDAYVKDYVYPGLVKLNPGMYRIGNCAWRPKIMLMELDVMKEGDILIYRDGNIKRYGNSIGDYDNIRNIALKCLERCGFDFFMPRENEHIQLKHLAKTNIIRELGADSPFTYHFPNLICNLLIVRKSPSSMELLMEWDKACQVEKWIDVKQYGDLHPDFMWSCPEQSILGVIIANWVRMRRHAIPLKYPVIGFEGRNINKPVTFNNYKYLNHIGVSY